MISTLEHAYGTTQIGKETTLTLINFIGILHSATIMVV